MYAHYPEFRINLQPGVVELQPENQECYAESLLPVDLATGESIAEAGGKASPVVPKRWQYDQPGGILAGPLALGP